MLWLSYCHICTFVALEKALIPKFNMLYCSLTNFFSFSVLWNTRSQSGENLIQVTLNRHDFLL